MLLTGKSILLHKNKKILTALTVTISNIVFYTIISKVITSDDIKVILLISVAGGLGTLITLGISDKFSKDKLYVNIFMSDDITALQDLANYLRSHRIINSINDSYTKEWNKTFSITAYVYTKHESNLLDKYIEETDIKFKRVVNK